MNSSSNYIGGDSLVNGSFMIKYVLPPTNQPVIIYTNADVPQLQPARTNSCVDQHPHDNGANITSIDIGSDAAAQIGDIKDWEEVVDPGEAIEINIARGTKICFGLSTISSFEVSVDVGGTYVLWTPTPESPMSDKHIPHARVRLKPGVNRPETLYLRGLCVASK